MLRTSLFALALGVTSLGATAGDVEKARLPGGIDDQRPIYVQVIVKACPVVENSLEPINQGKSYDEELALSLADRKAVLAALGCIDVPIPMEWMTAEMTPEACRGHAGYTAAMQFLQQRQDLAEFRAVGAWQCMITDHQVIGVISQ
jgi:hypothetical protein